MRRKRPVIVSCSAFCSAEDAINLMKRKKEIVCGVDT